MFPALESKISSNGRKSDGSKNLRESVIELQQSQQTHLAQENFRRKPSTIDQEPLLYKLTEKINTFFLPDYVVNPSLLSQIGCVFRERVPKTVNTNNDIQFLDCFTGTVAVVSIFYKRKVYILLKFVKITNKN